MRTLLAALLLSVGACGPNPDPEAAPTPAPDVQTVCCDECKLAASTDPSAMNLDLVPCVDYRRHTVNGEPALSEACAAWFSEHPAMVQDCR
ncbi:MAG: hypothetical protein GY898_25610 [Proteobacteria bacterium]|nr:hypothetical protein [Pseudomonadota bacterium]